MTPREFYNEDRKRELAECELEIERSNEDVDNDSKNCSNG